MKKSSLAINKCQLYPAGFDGIYQITGVVCTKCTYVGIVYHTKICKTKVGDGWECL